MASGRLNIDGPALYEAIVARETQFSRNKRNSSKRPLSGLKASDPRVKVIDAQEGARLVATSQIKSGFMGAYSFELTSISAQPVKHSYVMDVEPDSLDADEFMERSSTEDGENATTFTLLMEHAAWNPDSYTRLDWLLTGTQQQQLHLLSTERAKRRDIAYYRRPQSQQLANAQLKALPFSRTCIISPKANAREPDFDVLGGGAANNRLLLSQGYMCSYVVCLEASESIKSGETIIADTPESMLAPTTADEQRPVYLVPVKLPPNASESQIGQLVLALFNHNEQYNPNDLLTRLICDLAPLIISASTSSVPIESSFARYYKSQAFYTKWFQALDSGQMQLPPTDVSPGLSYDLIVNQYGQHVAQFLANSNSNPIQVVEFMKNLVHQNRTRIDAGGFARLGKRLYRAAHINFFLSDQQRTEIYRTIYDEKNQLFSIEPEQQQQQKQHDAVVWKERALWLAASNRLLIVPLLGKTNVLYRDALYFMDDCSAKLPRLDMRSYNEMVIYQGNGVPRLLQPFREFVGRILVLELDDYHKHSAGPLSYNMRDLKVEFIYTYGFFRRTRGTEDFAALLRIFSRLYGVMRLLPVNQLEDAWLQRAYTRYFGFFLTACHRFITNAADVDQTAPPLPKHANFDEDQSPDFAASNYKQYKSLLLFDAGSLGALTIESVLALLDQRPWFPLVTDRVRPLALYRQARQGSAVTDLPDFSGLTVLKAPNDKPTSHKLFRTEAYVYKFMKSQAEDAMTECNLYAEITTRGLRGFPVVCDTFFVRGAPPSEGESSADNRPYIVIKMERMDWILGDRWDALEPKQRLRYAKEVAMILRDARFCHQDLVPRNIGFKRGHIVLFDLGKAFIQDDHDMEPDVLAPCHADCKELIDWILKSGARPLIDKILLTELTTIVRYSGPDASGPTIGYDRLIGLLDYLIDAPL